MVDGGGLDDVCEHAPVDQGPQFKILKPSTLLGRGTPGSPGSEQAAAPAPMASVSSETREPQTAWITRVVNEAKETVRPEDVERITAEILQDEHFFSDCEDPDE